jgi:hypothetical protein
VDPGRSWRAVFPSQGTRVRAVLWQWRSDHRVHTGRVSGRESASKAGGEATASVEGSVARKATSEGWDDAALEVVAEAGAQEGSGTARQGVCQGHPRS